MLSSRPKSAWGGFHPPHCPNRHCPGHRPRAPWRYVRSGSWVRPSDGRRFRAFRCCLCATHFSARSFSPSYWLRRRDLLAPIAAHVCEGAGLRQTARLLQTTHATVARHVARLGRHCLLFHYHHLAAFPLPEPLVVDGFESFEYSQYFPFHANLAVGAESWFLYFFTDSPLRRKGVMTPAQKHRRAELEALLGRPDPKAVERGITDLLRRFLERVATNPWVLHTDDHPAYHRALRRLRGELPAHLRLEHHVTSSTVRRTQRNPLFPVNLADLLLRHANANHRRETIAFSKRRQAALERLALFTVWRNYIKRRRENGPRRSAAMWVGIIDRFLTWREVLRRRLFPAHASLPRRWQDYYEGQVRTAIYGTAQRTHAARFAF